MLVAAACGSSGGSNPPSTQPTPTVTSVTVGGAGAPVAGDSVQLTATANLSDGTTQAVTSQSTWESSNSAIATVSASGMATFIAAGAVDIKATYKSVAGTSHVTVNAKGPSKYTLTGTVTDVVSGEKLANVTVTIVDGTDAGRATATDANGKYSLGGVTAGSFTLRFANVNYETKSMPVTVSADTTVDAQVTALSNLTRFYGTYNVRLSTLQQSCSFPFEVGPTGTFKIDGSTNGSSMTITIVERGTTRQYGGSISSSGAFNGSSLQDVIAGFTPSINKHSYSGSISGSATGSSVTGTEFVNFKDPCPGATMQIGYTGGK